MVGALGPQEEIRVRSACGEGSTFEFSIYQFLDSEPESADGSPNFRNQTSQEFDLSKDVQQIYSFRPNTSLAHNHT